MAGYVFRSPARGGTYDVAMALARCARLSLRPSRGCAQRRGTGHQTDATTVELATTKSGTRTADGCSRRRRARSGQPPLDSISASCAVLVPSTPTA